MPRDMLMPTHDDSLAARALDIFRRRKLLTLIVFTAVMTSAVSLALYLPDLYQGQATVLVERQMPETFVRPAVSGELEGRLHVIRQEVLSRTHLTELINRFSLYPDIRATEPIDTAIDQMRHDIAIELTGPEQVTGRKTTVAFQVTYTGTDGPTSAAVTNAIADFYVNQNYDIRSGEATRTTEFLKTQLEETRKQLDARERDMRAYIAAHPGELPQQLEVNLAAIERMNTQLRLNGERQLKLLEDRERLSGGVTAITINTATGEKVTVGAPRSERLESMKKELAALEAKFTSRHPDVVRLKTEVAAEERRQQDAVLREAKNGGSGSAPAGVAAVGAGAANAAGTSGADPDSGAERERAVNTLNAEVERLRAEEGQLRSNISTLERRLEMAPEREQEFGRITRDYQAAKDLYDSLLKKYDEAALGESMEVDKQGERFRVLEPALPPPSPVAPNRLRLLLIGFMLAAAAGAAAALVVEQFDTTFHSVDMIREFTSVPVLATIPDIPSGTGNRALRVAVATASIVAVIALSAVATKHIALGNEQIVWMLTRGT